MYFSHLCIKFFLFFIFFVSLERFYGANCARSFFFFCKTGNNSIFIPQSKIWSDAQQYCEDNYDGLATPYSLNAAVIPNDFPVWIGLHRNGKDKHKCMIYIL